MNHSNIGIILLAAGSSSRLGYPKQMIHFRGESLLAYMSKIALASQADEVMVVLGAGGEALSSIFIDIPIDVSYNESWEKGIGNSLKHGLSVFRTQHPNLTAVIIMLCDQPFVTSSLLNQLIATHLKTTKGVVASAYGDTKGVPALFHHSYFDELAQLDDDRGARSIIRNLDKTELACITFEKGTADLDTEDDLIQYLKNNH